MTEERAVPVARLGDLERAVMEVLWDLPRPSADSRQDPNPLGVARRTTAASADTDPDATEPTATAREVAEVLTANRSLAYTTVLTVLDRLERKGMVRRLRAGRAHRYAPVATREAYVAELMLEALGRASDRDAALMRFVDSVSGEEAEVLRRALLGDAEDDAAAAARPAPEDRDELGGNEQPREGRWRPR